MDYRTGIFVVLCLACSHFRFDYGAMAAPTADPATNATDANETTTPVPPTADSNLTTVVPTAVVPTSGDNSTSNETETTASPVVTVAPVTTMPPVPEIKKFNLTMTFKIDAVTVENCKLILAAENPMPITEPPVTTLAPTLAPNTTEAEGNVTTPVAVSTAAPDANGTETPANNTRRRRSAEEFDADTFVEATENELKKLIEKAGGKNVSVTINRKEIVCGSVNYKKVDFNGGAAETLLELKEELKKQTTRGLTIQGIEVTEAELNLAVESVSEVTDETVDPTVTEDGLSGGAIAGIVIGVILGVVLIAFVVLHLMKKQQKQATISSNSRVKLSEVQDGH